MPIKSSSLISPPKLKRLLTFASGIAVACAMSVSAAHADDDTADIGIGRFNISHFEVSGNSLLTQQVIDSVLAPFTGPQRNFGDVQRALEALEQQYHRLGYNVVLVTLPEQELNQGVVKFQVIEARLGKVSIEGNHFVDEANVRNSLPQLREGQTPNLGKLSLSLKLSNENPAKKTTLQLQEGESIDGDTVNAVVKVTDERPWKIGASVDNTGNASTGDSRVSVQFQHANIADRDQVLSLQYTTSIEKPSQVSVYGAGYHIPLYELGDSIDLFGSYSNVDSGTVSAGLFNLQVSGRGGVYGARYNQNLPRVGGYESRVIYGVDYKAFQNDVTLIGTQLGNDITVHPVSLGYAGTLIMSNAQFDFNVVALHNISGGKRGSADDFNQVRAGASASYNMLRYGAVYNQVLPADWQTRLVISGQYSKDALVPGEQFGAGGGNSVRGFEEREIANDSGALFNAELYTPNLCSGIGRFAAQCRALAFYDAARVKRNHALPGETEQSSIGSAGLGMRMNMDKYLALQLDYGRVLDAGTVQAKGDSRMHFRLSVLY